MTTRRADALLSNIRNWASRHSACEPSDQELLERFIRSREQTAFAALVARHGPRVLGVCRRVLRDEHAAEDAFQDVFVLLARKAASLRERTLLAGWLYGAACRTAAHARAAAARRRAREALAEAGHPSGDPAVEAAARELSAVLDEEVGRLPERYRNPLVLCHVEGQTQDEAARRLGCSPRTLHRLLKKGRALLRTRLGRRGVTLSASLIAPTLWGRPAAATVSARLASAAVEAAVTGPSVGALSGIAGAAAGRVVRTSVLTRTQVGLGLLAAACLVGSGVGIADFGTAKSVPQSPLPVAAAREAAPRDPPQPGKRGVSMPIDPRRLAKLAKQLRSKDPDERSAALATLEKVVPAKGAGGMDFGPVIEPLLDLCGWGGEAEKDAHRAERLIVRIGGQTAPSIRLRLDARDAHDRRVGAELLSRVEPPGPGPTELLRPLLADADHYVRRAAIQGLGVQGPAAKAAIGDLEKAGTDPNLPNRVTAAVALIHIGGASKERVGALADLLHCKEPCDGAAAYAATELGKLGRRARSAAPQLLEAVKHPDAQVRVEAAYALARVGADPKKAVAALTALLKDDPEREVRRSAAAALGDMGPAAAAAVPALRRALRGAGGGWWVAADALGKIGGPDAVAALVEALTSKDDDVRLTAIRRLGDLGGAASASTRALDDARKADPRESNRKAAVEALKKITGQTCREHRSGGEPG